MKSRQDKIVAAILAALVIIISLSSCATNKNGCGSYAGWESHTKFRSK